MSLQNLTASLVAGRQETSIALANLNFDFSLFKVEAPAEFKPLGDELNAPRRAAAESGTPHVTARKLGALFQRLLPPTPELIRAYGRRVSEIASSRAVNPKGTKADGVFAEQVGVDGTSIWAAATSGPESIAVHLLACMLARIWSGSEATSIWVELVSERKKELATADESEPGYLSSIAAAQISLSRDQLAEWDASARAWLRAADQGMAVRQKQLTLVLNNVNVPVNKKMSLYQSVLHAWKSAMTATDRLIQGMPQSVQDGATLLGLSSWHIYPDMVVLGNASTEVKQTDHLVGSGGILTIGLQFDSREHENGVYWSLPLAHLRYYGGPVLSAKSTATHGSRISIEQLLHVSVGCLIQTWDSNMAETAAFFTHLWDMVSSGATAQFSRASLSHWLALLTYAVEPLFGSDHVAQKLCQQLIRFGERRCPHFLFPATDTVPPLFGLANLDTLVSLLLSEESRIEVLRDFAARVRKRETELFIIRYARASGEFEYATALPIQRSSSKRSQEGTSFPSTGHVRWVVSVEMTDGKLRFDPHRVLFVQGLGEDSLNADAENIVKLSKESFQWKQAPKMFFDHFDECSAHEYLDLTDYGDEPSTLARSGGDVVFSYVAGDVDKAALFAVDGVLQGEIDATVSMTWINKALRSGAFHRKRLLRHLDDFISLEQHASLMTSLRALITLTEIYKMLPDATVALSVTSQPLYDMPWIPKNVQDRTGEGGFLNLQTQFSGFSLDWESTFACIALFESGAFAVQPDSLHSVFAMSAGDSLYIAAPLLCDPCNETRSHEVRRIRGNIGRPGIAMLIPPQSPRIREFDVSAWQLVNHANFDGRLEDSFQTTSLHLSFTDYVLPIDVGAHGSRDNEIYFLESLVSIHDRGQWVADLDILRMRSVPYFHRTTEESCGRCSEGDKANAFVIGKPEFTMIDNWMELLDRPNNTVMVRSRGNWIGRLAATTLSLQQGHPTFALPNKFCWSCVRGAWVQMADRSQAALGKVMPDANEDQDAFYNVTLPSMTNTESESGAPRSGAPLGSHQNSTKTPRQAELLAQEQDRIDHSILSLMGEAKAVIIC